MGRWRPLAVTETNHRVQLSAPDVLHIMNCAADAEILEQTCFFGYACD